MMNRFKIYILILCAFLYSDIEIPDSNLDGWVVLNDDKIWVGYKDYKGFPWCRSITTLPYSIEKIVPIVDNFENYKNIFVRINDSKKLAEDIVYLKIDMPLFYSDRDYIVQYNSFEKNDTIIYQWQSVDMIAEYPDIVRLDNAAGEWQLIPVSDNSTMVSYSWNGELLGDFPSFYLTRAWATQGVEILSWLKEELHRQGEN